MHVFAFPYKIPRTCPAVNCAIKITYPSKSFADEVLKRTHWSDFARFHYSSDRASAALKIIPQNDHRIFRQMSITIIIIIVCLFKYILACFMALKAP